MEIVKKHNVVVSEIERLKDELIGLQPEIMLTFKSLNDIEKIAMLESMKDSDCSLELYSEMESHLKEAIEDVKY